MSRDQIPSYIQNNGEKAQSENPFLNLILLVCRRYDLMLLIPMIALMVIGACFIYSTGQQVGGIYATFWKRQLVTMGLGFAIWFTLSMIDYRWFGPASIILYPVSVYLLIHVLFAGVVLYGARRWLDFGFTNLQPSELGKIAVILLCSWLLSFKGADINKFKWMLITGAIVGIPFVLIMKEPDLGTSLVLVPAAAAIVFAAKLKWRYIIILAVVVAAMMPLAYFSLHDYQKDRIKVFLDPERDPQNRGWNQIQAEMAVGSGGLIGKGFMQGTHNTLGYLPQTVSNSDFIFPVIAEETGFVGTIMLIVLYMFLVLAILRTAMLASDDFGRYLCAGIAAVFFFHTFINIGMSIRLAPVTGLPLPLVSYGGTFMIATMTYLGIVQSVYAHREKDSMMSV